MDFLQNQIFFNHSLAIEYKPNDQIINLNDIIADNIENQKSIIKENVIEQNSTQNSNISVCDIQDPKEVKILFC